MPVIFLFEVYIPGDLIVGLWGVWQRKGGEPFIKRLFTTTLPSLEYSVPLFMFHFLGQCMTYTINELERAFLSLLLVFSVTTCLQIFLVFFVSFLSPLICC